MIISTFETDRTNVIDCHSIEMEFEEEFLEFKEELHERTDGIHPKSQSSIADSATFSKCLSECSHPNNNRRNHCSILHHRSTNPNNIRMDSIISRKTFPNSLTPFFLLFSKEIASDICNRLSRALYNLTNTITIEEILIVVHSLSQCISNTFTV